MFGLTKREQRWKAEQKAAETLLGFVSCVAHSAAEVRAAEALADSSELARLRQENVSLLRDLRMSTNVIRIQLQTIKELEAQIAKLSSPSQGGQP